MITLYHGTTLNSAKAIEEAGSINGPVFLTSRPSIAQDFGEIVIEVCVAEDNLMVDFDLPSQALVDLEEARNIVQEPEWEISDFLAAGYSVATPHSLSI